MNLIWVVLIVLLILALVGSPVGGLNLHSYGWKPSGLLGVVLVVLLILLLLGKL